MYRSRVEPERSHDRTKIGGGAAGKLISWTIALVGAVAHTNNDARQHSEAAVPSDGSAEKCDQLDLIPSSDWAGGTQLTIRGRIPSTEGEHLVVG